MRSPATARRRSGPTTWLAWALATPVMMTVAYGGMRIVMAVLTQLRDGIFAKVAMNAVRRLALRTFEHMHLLSLRFHLERKTGGLTRVLERGRNAIETIVRMVLLQLAPTMVELVLVAWVLLVHFDWRYRRRHRGDGRALYVVHLLRHRVAHRHPPRDERRATPTPTPRRSIRCSITRPSNISPPRRARPRATTARWRATRTRASSAYMSLSVLNAGQAVDVHRSGLPPPWCCAPTASSAAPIRSAISS